LCSFLIHCDTTSNIFYIKNKISIDRQQISTTKTTLRLLWTPMYTYGQPYLLVQVRVQFPQSIVFMRPIKSLLVLVFARASGNAVSAVRPWDRGWCVASCTICMQNFIWLEPIITELCFSLLFNKHSYPTNDVTRCAESAIYILHIFAYNFGTRWDRIEH
jgi:hypothetical protein